MSTVLVADSPEVSLDQQYSEQAVAGQQATSSKGREVTIKIDCVVHSNSPRSDIRYLCGGASSCAPLAKLGVSFKSSFSLELRTVTEGLMNGLGSCAWFCRVKLCA